MTKFFTILKKEVRELMTLQLILPMLISILVFAAIGQIVSNEAAKQENITEKILVVDPIKSNYSDQLIKAISERGFEVNLSKEDSENVVEDFQNGQTEEKFLLIFPENFSENIDNFIPAEIQLFTRIKGLSITDTSNYQILLGTVYEFSGLISLEKISQVTDLDSAIAVKEPIYVEEFVTANGNIAQVQLTAVQAYLTAQTTFIPVILFLAITFAAQLIIVSVASEKENKTLETLLSMPVNRKTIIIAKLTAAGIVALFFVVIYLLGMNEFMSGVTSGVEQIGASADANVVEQLGLVLTTYDFVILGISIFLGILVALAIAFILGALAEDTKKAQALIAPLMIMLLIPYLLTILLDINTLSTGLKVILYIIPFTHIFMVTPNLLLGNYLFIILGDIYLFVVFVVAVYFAAKLFMSESFLTISSSLNLKKLKSYFKK